MNIGRISGLFGTRGWLKVFSYTRPRDGLFEYRQWYVDDEEDGTKVLLDVATGKVQGNALIVKITSIDDRTTAAAYVDREIYVTREQFKALPPGEFYWADLTGLLVKNRDGLALGKVRRLIETGANDVLEVIDDKTRLIPYVPEVFVLDVDLESGTITVDWHSDD